VLVYISLSYATFGLIASNGRIVDAPPIARWTIGKYAEYVVEYYKHKGANIIWPVEM